MRYGMSQQSVGADIERHSEESIRRTLVELAVYELGILFNFELKERMTGRQVHQLTLRGVPARDDQATRVRVPFDVVDEARKLVNAVSLRIVAAKGTAEVAVHRPQIARRTTEAARMLFFSPLLPQVNPPPRPG